MSNLEKTIKNQVSEALISSGWDADRHGNYLRTVKRGEKESKFRVKLKDLVCRIEVLVEGVAPKDKNPGHPRMWVKVGGDYYRNVRLEGNGLVWIGSYKFGRNR